MRRGHPGMGGWRNENPRHFRPRDGGGQHYGPQQPYHLLSLQTKYGGPRGPGPRPHRGTMHYNTHGASHRDRYTYRRGQSPRLPDHGRYPPPPHRHIDTTDQISPYKKMLTFCENRNKPDQCLVNSMGDIDHRQQNFGEPPPILSIPPPWIEPNARPSFDDRSPQKRPNQFHDNTENQPTFTSHRPPTTSDYGGNIPAAIENSDSFSRSVDDTVDIVRKKLLNRNEPHVSTEMAHTKQDLDQGPGAAPITSTIQGRPPTPPARKRLPRRQNVKSNCDKIKNNIVHQLFKMDKEKIHKLMDNPNSSTKFEYAISSLITESQNSLDRHLRSVAEKSLYSSSEEFIHNDSNTIYEDTFLKQMQCILEPQDTVLLEDIKPIVMAELTKALQLNELDQRFDVAEEDANYYPAEDTDSTNMYSDGYGYEEISENYPEENIYYEHHQPSFNTHNTPDSPTQEFHQDHIQVTQLYERRAPRKSCDTDEIKRQEFAKSREQLRKSMEEERNRLKEERRKCDSPVPVFAANADQMSEDDPFADLDLQYHVAVDHNFIEAELDKQLISATEASISDTESISKAQVTNNKRDKSPIKKEVLPVPQIDPKSIKTEIDSQILNIAKSPLKLSSSLNRVKDNHVSSRSQNTPTKHELINTSDPEIINTINHGVPTENLHQDKINKDKVKQEPEIKDSLKSENSNTVKTAIPSTARKRSIDQKPSHRKEKRKKSDTSPESNKQILNKNIIINVNDCSSKSAEKKCDSAKSIFNLFFSKDESGKESPKDPKNLELSDKGYSDKYVKRKETPKKKDHEIKRNRSSSTSHSISPKENNNICSETQPKTDSKNKLKPIDMFLDHPKKPVTSHQAHRNSAQPVITKKVEDKKPIQPVAPKSKSSINKRHIATQVILKVQAKETQTSFAKNSLSKVCQTDVKKMTVKATQTTPVSIEKTGIKSCDAFERMKEIDLEIQVLLQEKFKLYNSLEAKESGSAAIQNFGMTVLNVTPNEEVKDDVEDGLSEDTIVDDFTSIPVEELEQIALETVTESVQEIPKESHQLPKRNRRQKVVESVQKEANIPVKTYKTKKQSNAPNISLIEQIITDDRPLEDIISLDELEVPEIKEPTVSNKKKSQRISKTSKKKSKKGKSVKLNTTQIVNRECFVLLNREDVTKYLNRNVVDAPKKAKKAVEKVEKEELLKPVAIEKVEKEVRKPIEKVEKEGKPVAVEKVEVAEVPDVAAETMAADSADIQFDMLDVSEDIVIGDVCEIKCSEEKDASGHTDSSVNEEIILDNSQSSSDDVVPEMGQQENECKLFDFSSDETLKRDSITVTGNADAVLAIECIDNDFIAACLDGNVYHFNNDGQLLTTLRGSNLAVTCLTIVKEKSGTTVITGSLDSRIRYYDLETGLEKGPECNGLSPIQTMDRAWGTVFVGTRTGFVLQFDCRNNMLIPVSTVKFSEQSILALRALREGPRKVLLVAARSENVTIKDAQTGLLLRTLEGPKMTVYTLLFEDSKVYCGTSTHQIQVFDYASGSHSGTHEGGKGCVCLRAAGGLLFAGCYDGGVYVFREGQPRPLAQLRGPGVMLLALAVVGTKVRPRGGQPRPLAQLREPGVILLALAVVGTKVRARGGQPRPLAQLRGPAEAAGAAAGARRHAAGARRRRDQDYCGLQGPEFVHMEDTTLYIKGNDFINRQLECRRS